MKWLLDTHVVLWVLDNHPSLSPKARRLLVHAEAVFVSPVSIWEMQIKATLGKLTLPEESLAPVLTASGMKPLPVTWQHADALRGRPLLHRAPFDRLLIAQAVSEPLRLLTADRELSAYSELVTTI